MEIIKNNKFVKAIIDEKYNTPTNELLKYSMYDITTAITHIVIHNGEKNTFMCTINLPSVEMYGKSTVLSHTLAIERDLLRISYADVSNNNNGHFILLGHLKEILECGFKNTTFTGIDLVHKIVLGYDYKGKEMLTLGMIFVKYLMPCLTDRQAYYLVNNPYYTDDMYMIYGHITKNKIVAEKLGVSTSMLAEDDLRYVVSYKIMHNNGFTNIDAIKLATYFYVVTYGSYGLLRNCDMCYLLDFMSEISLARIFDHTLGVFEEEQSYVLGIQDFDNLVSEVNCIIADQEEDTKIMYFIKDILRKEYHSVIDFSEALQQIIDYSDDSQYEYDACIKSLETMHHDIKFQLPIKPADLFIVSDTMGNCARNYRNRIGHDCYIVLGYLDDKLKICIELDSQTLKLKQCKGKYNTRFTKDSKETKAILSWLQVHDIPVDSSLKDYKTMTSLVIDIDDNDEEGYFDLAYYEDQNRHENYDDEEDWLIPLDLDEELPFN